MFYKEPGHLSLNGDKDLDRYTGVNPRKPPPPEGMVWTNTGA